MFKFHNSLEEEGYIVDPKNEEIKDPISSQEEDLNVETYVKFSIENYVLPLVPKEASFDVIICFHEEDVSEATTSSILDKVLVSHYHIPFQISKYNEEYLHYLKRVHLEEKSSMEVGLTLFKCSHSLM